MEFLTEFLDRIVDFLAIHIEIDPDPVNTLVNFLQLALMLAAPLAARYVYKKVKPFFDALLTFTDAIKTLEKSIELNRDGIGHNSIRIDKLENKLNGFEAKLDTHITDMKDMATRTSDMTVEKMKKEGNGNGQTP